jgi:pyruvate dehydrogenase E2 component (dihydrolipoamide acetyltransferase)
LQEAKSQIPHFYVTHKADVGRLLDLREELKGVDVKLTINDFIIKACSLALKDHQEINSGFNEKNQTLLRFNDIDISIAVDVEEGLITPILKNAFEKHISEISEEVKELVTKAKAGKLQLHEFQGGSFTISNLGMFGICDFAAIINPPQGAILAVGGIEKGLKMVDGSVVESSTLSFTLSVDHRVIDGAQAARFLKTLKGYLEAPALLLM